MNYREMEISLILVLIVVSGVALADKEKVVTISEKDIEETTTYNLDSTTDDVWTTTTTAATTTLSSSSSSSTSTASSTSSSSSPTSTTSNPNDWKDLDDKEAETLVKFVVAEIQKLKVEHKELDDCQELDLSSVLSGKKQEGKPTKYSVTLKVQPQMKKTEDCQHDNSTMVNLHPEICEADILEGDHGGTKGKTLLRSTCLQVEELQD